MRDAGEKLDMRENWTEKSADIIIPIYNAYEDLVKCLESIYKYTDLEKNRLILINDNSPDERIRPLLEEQRKNNTIVLHNEVNKGFSNNINLGMEQSTDHDVILLNSDTIVTEKWVEKMVECAYSDEAIATVTPLSNNASLCSVPKFCEENELPEYLSIGQAGEIVERCSLKRYPRITVANGFCMLIKREVINAIGRFDAGTFGRGYGEENDFCNRAEQVGYHHVMCDDTYIFHSGTKSFVSKEKGKYIRQHDKILRERYPEQMHLNDVHVRDNPNGFVGENVEIYFECNNGKKNILYVLQSDFRKDAADHVGGTQFHVRDLVSELKDKYNIFVAARNGAYLNLTIYIKEKERKFRFYIGPPKKIYEFKNRIFSELWINIIAAFHIDLIHVHHVKNTSFDIFYVAREFGIPLVLTLHDFFFVCPSVTLTRDDNVSDVCCLGRNMDCRECLHTNMGITDHIDYISIWRKKCAEVLLDCRKLIIPDQSASDILESFYPMIKEKIRVIEHGYVPIHRLDHMDKGVKDLKVMYEKFEKSGFSYKLTGWVYLKEKEANKDEKIYLEIRSKSISGILIPAAKICSPDGINDSSKSMIGFSCILPQKVLKNESTQIKVALEKDGNLIYAKEAFVTPKLYAKKKRLNIAFIGGLNKAKGGEVVNEILKNLKDDVNWHIFGGIGVEKLAFREQKNLIKTGCYAPEDLPDLLLLHEIDLIAILSVWPETYSYTLTEAVLNGIPVIVTDIGALGRRVKEMNCGWTVSLDHMKEDFLHIVQGLLKDKSELVEYGKAISKLKIPDIKEMSGKYQGLYESLWNERPQYPKADYALILSGYYNGERHTGAVMQNDNIEQWRQNSTFYRFKRRLQNDCPRLYIILRKMKGYLT